MHIAGADCMFFHFSVMFLYNPLWKEIMDIDIIHLDTDMRLSIKYDKPIFDPSLSQMFTNLWPLKHPPHKYALLLNEKINKMQILGKLL